MPMKAASSTQETLGGLQSLASGGMPCPALLEDSWPEVLAA
jgi:hypothetical protein